MNPLASIPRKLAHLNFWPLTAAPKNRSIVASYSKNRNELYSRLLEALKKEGIPYFTGGASRPYLHKRIHFRLDDASRVFTFLSNFNFGRVNVQFRPIDASVCSLRQLKTYTASPNKHAFDLLITEKTAPLRKYDVHLVARILVDFWSPVQTYSPESLMICPRGTPQFRQVRAAKLEELFTQNRDIDIEGTQDIYMPKFPIDAVYTWVNDQDPAWKQRKAFYSDKTKPAKTANRAVLAERFRNRDELRYSLRSLEMFAPWIRNIYIVTDDQVPDWLNLESGRIHIVSHREIYSDPSWLPTFNSTGIEGQLHHIKGIAEHFLYFNDDFFLGQMCHPEDFFHANGLPKYFFSDQISNESDIDDTREEYLIANRNSIQLLKRDFGLHARRTLLHVPYATKKSLMYEIEKKYQNEFDQCAAQRFRSAKDFRTLTFLQPHYGFLTAQATEGEISHRYLALWKPNIDKQLTSVLTGMKYKTFCINDVGIPEDRLEAVGTLVRDFLQSYFPVPSSFEKNQGTY
jgi:hypothetical protein